MKGPNELWQPKNAVYFLNEFQFQFFFCQLGWFVLQFFWWLLFIFFITFLKEVLASLFSRGTFFVGVRKKDFEENNQTKKEKKKIMRSR